MHRREAVARMVLLSAVLAVPLLYGGLALVLGQDANWDLRNYHYYNPYAFLHGRRDFDILPAHVATFYNPLLHVPFYWLVEALPPRGVGFILGAVQGLNLLLLLGLAVTCFGGPAGPRRAVAAVAVAAAGLLGAMAVSEVGTSFGDNVISLPVLGALLLLAARSRRLGTEPAGRALASVAAAGLIAGAAAGLKQPAVIFAVGLCAACFAIPGPFWRRFSLSFGFGLGVLAGIAATDGFWLWDMWARYGNPLFPYFNEFFQAPMATIGDYKDNRFVPNQWHEVAFFPYLFTFGSQGVSEIAFFDLRPVIVYTLFLAWPLAALWRRAGGGGGDAAPLTAAAPGNLLLAAMAVTWLVWMALFGIWRYMVPMEMLMPLAVVLLVDRWPVGRRARAAVAAALVAVAVVAVQPGSWGRVAWGSAYFGVPVPDLPEPQNTIVLMAGHDATAYVVPAFPPAVRFIRIQGWFTGPSARPNGFDRLMAEAIDHHAGPLYILFREREERATARDALAAYGLAIDEAGCRELHTALERDFANPLGFCPVERLAGRQQQGQNR